MRVHTIISPEGADKKADPERERLKALLPDLERYQAEGILLNVKSPVKELSARYFDSGMLGLHMLLMSLQVVAYWSRNACNISRKADPDSGEKKRTATYLELYAAISTSNPSAYSARLYACFCKACGVCFLSRSMGSSTKLF